MWFSLDFETRFLCPSVLHEHYGRVVFLFRPDHEGNLLRPSMHLGYCVRGLLSVTLESGRS